MIIGLGFQARSGKDTVADFLVENHGFTKIAFADALKEGAGVIFGLDHDQLYGDKKDVVDEFWEDTPRNILQKMGTECMRRGYRDDLWIKCVERAITRHEGLKWAISDVRFPNEARAVKEWGGFVVRVDRPEAGLSGDAAKLHASETSMIDYDGWDHVITNDRGLLELKAEAAAMLKAMKAPNTPQAAQSGPK
jgi:hypothetical protein